MSTIEINLLRGFCWKTRQLEPYVANFQRKLRRKSLELTAAEIASNAELDFKSAIATNFTQVLVWGCCFRFGEACFKKMKELQWSFHYTVQDWFFAESLCTGLSASFLCPSKTLSFDAKHKCSVSGNGYSPFNFLNIHGFNTFSRTCTKFTRSTNDQLINLKNRFESGI